MFHLAVPATSANIGPGFDSLGLALSLWNDFEFREAGKTKILGVPEEFAGPDNLFLRAFAAACSRLETDAPPIELRISSKIPLARGLGSSASLIVAGVAAAVLAGSPARTFTPNEMQFILDVAAEIEGHPDNVAPAVYGGFCASAAEGRDEGRATPRSRPRRIFCSRSDLPPSWRFHALIPPFELSTAAARAALPEAYSRADAVFNAGRAALVALAIREGNLGLLGQACEDRLHQPYRAPLIPGWREAVAALRGAGAKAVWLSGAGPTVMGVSEAGKGGSLSSNLPGILELPGGSWTHLELEGVNSGLCVL